MRFATPLGAARGTVAAACALMAALTARADHLTLKDGRLFDEVVVRKEGDALAVDFPSGSVRVPLEDVLEYAIDGVEPEPRNEEERAKRAQGLVPWKGKWIRPEQRDRERAKEQEARKKDLEDWKGHQEWKDRYQFKTKNFSFESTLSPALNEEYSGLMETYFTEFGKKWKTRVPQEWGRLTVCFHSDEDAYYRTSGAPRGAIGYYKFVEPRELHFFFDRRNPSLTVAVMFHEANHYLTDLMDAEFQYPHWINEAMAEYYGASTFDREKGTMTPGGIQAGRLSEVRVDLAGDVRYNLADLLADETQGYHHYTWGWTLVHFLMEHPTHSKKFQKFFNDLARAPDVERRRGAWNFKTVSGAEMKRVFLSRMGMKEADLRPLQDAWYAHIESLQADGLAGIEETGIRAFREGKTKFKAYELLKQAVEKGSRRPQVHVHYAWILSMHYGGPEAALKFLEESCVRLPLEADVWAQRGFFARALGRQAEGAKYLALAKEIDPELDLLYLEIQLALQEKLSERAKQGGSEEGK